MASKAKNKTKKKKDLRIAQNVKKIKTVKSGGGKTMGELGLTREQLKKAYPWGTGPGYSPSK